MKKIAMLMAFSIILMGASAQKIKKTEGKTGFLKGQTEFSISFVYADDLKVGKKTEKQYIADKMEKANDKDPGAGEKWLSMWKADRVEHYEPKFIELFDDVLQEENIKVVEGADTKYGIIVKTTFIEPGFNVGVSRKNASVNLEVMFVDNAQPEKPLVTYTVLKSPGRVAFGNDYDTGARVGEAYAKAGKEMAKYLLKQKVF